MSYDPELKLAIDAAGGVSKLARGLGISPSAIPQWRQLPARHVPAVSRLTGIPRHELRPDLWERPEAAPPFPQPPPHPPVTP